MFKHEKQLLYNVEVERAKSTLCSSLTRAIRWCKW